MADYSVIFNEISELLQNGKVRDIADAYTPDAASAAEVCRSFYA